MYVCLSKSEKSNARRHFGSVATQGSPSRALGLVLGDAVSSWLLSRP